MNHYKLDNKQMDAAFLSGTEIICKVAMNEDEVRSEKIKVGDALIVILSTGSKYKGRVVSFTAVPIEKYVVGEMVVVRG